VGAGAFPHRVLLGGRIGDSGAVLHHCTDTWCPERRQLRQAVSGETDDCPGEGDASSGTAGVGVPGVTDSFTTGGVGRGKLAR
jgi:hypothetical protein